MAQLLYEYSFIYDVEPSQDGLSDGVNSKVREGWQIDHIALNSEGVLIVLKRPIGTLHVELNPPKEPSMRRGG